MRYWYFEFEGVFKKRNEESDYKGLFSSAMLFSPSKEDAKKDLIKDLEDKDIELIKVEDVFEFKESEVDFSNPKNMSWINMYEEVKRTKGCIFTPWHTFKID